MPSIKQGAGKSRRGEGLAKSRRLAGATRVTPKSAYSGIQFGSRRAVASSLAGVRMAAIDVTSMLNAAIAESPTKLNQLAVGLVGKRKRVGEERDSLRRMVRWATTGTSDATSRQQAIVRAYKANKREMLLIHGISELAPDDAAAFMRSYFVAGGSMTHVVGWLARAGKALEQRQPPARPALLPAVLPRTPRRTARPKPLTRGRQGAGLFDWVSDAADTVGDWISDGVDTVVDSVSTIVNAVLDAGKSMADAIAAAAGWAVGDIADVVIALLAVGNTVFSILTEALKLGASVLKKFVGALIGAGRAVGEVLAWVVSKTAKVIADTVAALFEAGKTIYDLVLWASGAASATARAVIRAVLDVGKTVGEIMAQIIRLSAVLAKKMLAALYAVTAALGQILASIAQSAASIVRTVLEGLFAIGVTLVQLVAAVFSDVAQAFRRGLIEGLIALGHAIIDILKAALLVGASTLALAFAVTMELFGGHRPLTTLEIREARKVFGGSIDLGRVRVAVASIPADVVNWLNSQRPFTTMYVINFASSAHITLPTLIHELTHVWQAVVAGPVYMVEALHSQVFGRGYDVTPADIAAANGDIRKLEREQQAVVVERYYIGKWGDHSFDPAIYEELAKDVYKGKPAPIGPLKLLPFTLPLPRVRERVPSLRLSAEL